MSDPTLDRVGTTLNGKWRLDALLGVGGAGAVYAATHRNGKSAAVKILHRELCTHPDLVARFVREGYIANQVEHPGVVSVLDDDRTEDGLVYLVMDRLHGMSLDETLAERGPALPLAEALTLTSDVLDVIATAHEKGIVHRDLKPENVFLLAGGGIKVLDFGIAKQQSSTANATLAGSVFGTPGFMPPEQARGRTALIDARTDVWAIGATLFVMLTGRRLHDAATPHESLLLAMTEKAPAARDVLPGLPLAVAEILDRALAFDRDSRFPSAREMQRAVADAMLATSGMNYVPSPPASPAIGVGALTRGEPERPPSPARAWGWIAAPAAGAIAIVSAVMVAVSHRSPPPVSPFRPEPAATTTAPEVAPAGDTDSTSQDASAGNATPPGSAVGSVASNAFHAVTQSASADRATSTDPPRTPPLPGGSSVAPAPPAQRRSSPDALRSRR